MSTSYAHTISDGQSALIFVKLLTRWKGSVYKLLWVDLVVYVGLFYSLHFIYRNLDLSNKGNFEEIIRYCETMKASIPLSFLLGFFVAGVVERWYQMFLAIPWLNRMAFLADGAIIGQTPERCRKVKATLMRYLVLSWILLMRKISRQIEERFSKKLYDSAEEHSVREILMNINRDKKIQSTFRKIITDSDIRAFENIAAMNFAKNSTKYEPEYWVPLQWCSRIFQKSLLNGYIVDMRTTMKLIEELDNLRNQMHRLSMLCSIMIPLVYTQVVIIAVYSYFLCLLFSSQFPVSSSSNGHMANSSNTHNLSGHNVDFFFYPLFTIFQFLFIMGWLKVAICLLNPFGDAQEDFRTSEILDINLDVCWRCATNDICSFPELLCPGNFWFRGGDSQYTDSFHNFIEAVEDDLEEIEQPTIAHDLVALEIKQSTCLKLQRCLCSICCHHNDEFIYTQEIYRNDKISKSRSSSFLDDESTTDRFKSANSLPLGNNQSYSSGDWALGSNANLLNKSSSRFNIFN